MTEKNVFISHYSKDDEHISKLKDLLKKNGYTIKNSSIDSTKPNNASSPEYIRGILSDRINWAGCVVVLIGPHTHSREWVNDEIEIAAKRGKRIVGIFINGASDAKLPAKFEEFGDALVGWTSEKIIDAINGIIDNFENSDGSLRPSKWIINRGVC
ncbi:TIR domain-containing protein [Desulfovibrio sp.]|uniref:TIR domain-containing protein n=1 Tax=Desulfovibrio sp. TaxID=885 RepID=UPI0025C1E6CB|nr:TIR domain-containing protein [Desulfovibrio sp.]